MSNKPKYRTIRRSILNFNYFVIQKKTWFGFYIDTNRCYSNKYQAEKYCNTLNVGMFEEIFSEYGFFLNRMISGSKSGYRSKYPDNYIIFNANIFIRSKHKIWYGDLDITKDAINLQKICNEIGEEMIVVSEVKGRFGAEKMKYRKIRKIADVIFTPNNNYYTVLEIDGISVLKIDNTYNLIGKPKKWNKIPIKNETL